MEGEQDRASLGLELGHLGQALALERAIPDRQHLIHQQHVGIGVDGHREEVDVVPRGELTVEPGVQLEQRRDATRTGTAPLVRATMPPSTRRSVDLPAPLAPISRHRGVIGTFRFRLQLRQELPDGGTFGLREGKACRAAVRSGEELRDRSPQLILGGRLPLRRAQAIRCRLCELRVCNCDTQVGGDLRVLPGVRRAEAAAARALAPSFPLCRQLPLRLCHVVECGEGELLADGAAGQRRGWSPLARRLGRL
jgi:hypothetical protein